jgi:hypothetical protein
MFPPRLNFVTKMPMLDKIRRWFTLHPNCALALLTIAALIPFLAKPFNIDDPLFIWTAHQIQSHPVNPYGFNVNWYGEAQPMWSVTENPPLASYYLALAAKIFGWSEIGLHIAFSIPVIAVILGTYRLARRFCDWPALAACLTLFTPVFLISSTTIMCDVSMLAFWVWAVIFWIEGIERNDFLRLAASELFITLATLTKYFGVCLIPLLIVYGLRHKRPFKQWAVYFLFPLAALCAYEWTTRMLYGHALFFDAADYASYARGNFSPITAILVAMAFVGGCVASTVFFAPLLWKWQILMIFTAGVMFVSFIKLHNFLSSAFVGIQIIGWAVGGVCVLALIVINVFRRRDAHSWLLALWVFGTILFVTFFNWTINARSILPITPAVAILLVLRLQQNILAGQKRWPREVTLCLLACMVFALVATQADYLYAKAVRSSAQQVVAKYGSRNSTLWFQGHWGFQFYMDKLGASELDLKHSLLKPGDRLALPLDNTGLFALETETTTVLETNNTAGPDGLTTWNGELGAGFYASTRGPLPFAFGHVPAEKVIVYLLKKPTTSTQKAK